MSRSNATLGASIGLDSCPWIEKHTACPRTYAEWHDWAERMDATHEQTRCPGCGFYAIWEPRKGAPDA